MPAETEVHPLSRAPAAATLMRQVLLESITALEDRLKAEKEALATIDALVKLPRVPLAANDFRPVTVIGGDILKRAQDAVDNAAKKS